VISISIVSHGQCGLVEALLNDLSACAGAVSFEVLLTLNFPEAQAQRFAPERFPFPLRILENPIPKGFGANHNAAFHHAAGQWFCVMNPDIRLPENPFPHMLAELERLHGALIAPATLSSAGQFEDSVRHFPTLCSLAMKTIGADDGRYAYTLDDDTFPAEWVGGMFMLFRADDFRRVAGFDEAFFLYYEDVDICVRLWKTGGKVLVCPKARAIHDAQRASRHNLRYMRWHLSSMARYFAKHWLRLPVAGRSI
jgi:N-acetylglucosaminyl-diphospho-decaprenol L-rhamnosyltransferase